MYVEERKGNEHKNTREEKTERGEEGGEQKNEYTRQILHANNQAWDKNGTLEDHDWPRVIQGSINIEYWNGFGQLAGGRLVGVDIVLVNEVSICTRIN